MTTATQVPNILETMQRFFPRELRHSPRSPKSAYTTYCPFHEDKNPSFSINEAGDLARCWSGCGGFNSQSFYQRATGRTRPDIAPVLPNKTPKGKLSKKQQPLADVTVSSLCEAKGLSERFVRETLGWGDSAYKRGGKTTQAVFMPYQDVNGELACSRYRVHLDGSPKYLWRKGSRPIPYGLPFIGLAREKKYIVIEEGETDFAALLSHNVPALGLAGNQMWKDEYFEILDGIESVYVMDEGGEPNPITGLTSGQVMVNYTTGLILKSARQRKLPPPALYRLKMPAGFKDPCEVAHVFQERTEAAIMDQMNKAEYLNPRIDYLATLGVVDSFLDSPSKRGHMESHYPEGSENPNDVISTQVKDLHADARNYVKEAFSNTRPSELSEEIFLFNTEYFLRQKRQIPLENPHIYPWQGQFGDNQTHAQYVEYSDGAWEKTWNPLSGRDIKRNPYVEKAEDCNCWGHLTCPLHGHNVPDGDRGKTKRGIRFKSSCGLKDDPGCGSSQSRTIAKAELPDLEEGKGSYRYVWIQRRFQLVGEAQSWPEQIRRETTLGIKKLGADLQTNVKRASTAKTTFRSGHSRVYHRCMWFHMDLPTTYAIHKVMFFEAEPGDLDRIVTKLAKDMGGEVVWDHNYQSGEDALLALTLAASASLGSIDRSEKLTEEERMDLHYAFWQGTHNQTIDMAMDALAKAMKTETTTEEPPRCEICSEKLYWCKDISPTVDSTSPTSPHYAYKTYQNTG